MGGDSGNLGREKGVERLVVYNAVGANIGKIENSMAQSFEGGVRCRGSRKRCVEVIWECLIRGARCYVVPAKEKTAQRRNGGPERREAWKGRSLFVTRRSMWRRGFYGSARVWRGRRDSNEDEDEGGK